MKHQHGSSDSTAIIIAVFGDVRIAMFVNFTFHVIDPFDLYADQERLEINFQVVDPLVHGPDDVRMIICAADEFPDANIQMVDVSLHEINAEFAALFCITGPRHGQINNDTQRCMQPWSSSTLT